MLILISISDDHLLKDICLNDKEVISSDIPDIWSLQSQPEIVVKGVDLISVMTDNVCRSCVCVALDLQPAMINLT